jgi:hypothetical protein
MEVVGIFLAIWSTYLTAIWVFWWPFGVFYGRFVYFSGFGMLYREKSGNPGQTISQNRCFLSHSRHFFPDENISKIVT